MTDLNKIWLAVAAAVLLCAGVASAVLTGRSAEPTPAPRASETGRPSPIASPVTTPSGKPPADKTAKAASVEAQSASPPKPVVVPPPVFHGLEYVSQAAIGLEDARRFALKDHPGAVTNSELGQDKSGRLRYVFTIGGSPVYVDATTGKVYANGK